MMFVSFESREIAKISTGLVILKLHGRPHIAYAIIASLIVIWINYLFL